MRNKTLVINTIFCSSLIALSACGFGGGSSSNSSSTTTTVSATVLLPEESNGSKKPGDFTTSSCKNLTESSLCVIKLTWSNLPATESSSDRFLNEPALSYPGDRFSASFNNCNIQIANYNNGSCILIYDFSPPPNKYVFFVNNFQFAITALNKNDYRDIYSSSIEVSASNYQFK
ncbi:MAG: hypothetical protein ACK5Z5_00050 [Neisseriaceae bacterium]